MNIGDKVRSIRGNEEGIVTNILPHNEIEVEIEDGFRIPFQARDLTVVSKSEHEHFGESERHTQEVIKRKNPVTESLAERGIYLAMPSLNDKLLDVILINNTDLNLLFTSGNEESDRYNGIASGQIEPRSYKKLTQLNMDKFDNWGSFLFQFMLHKKGVFSIQNPKVKKLRFKGASFFNSKSKAPIINKEAFLFQLDKQEVEIKAEEIIQNLYKKEEKGLSTEATIKRTKQKKGLKKEVDLHIEKIQTNSEFIPDEEKLSIQIDTFEKELDKAIFLGVDILIFIHGVGNGILKDEIQKRLAKNPNVDYFKDAYKGKFGFGATELKLK